MPIPKALEAERERIRKLAENDGQPDEQTPVGNAEPEPEPEHDEPEDTALAQRRPADSDTDTSPQPEKPAQEPQPAYDDTAIRQLQQEVERLTQSNRTLKGKLDAEVPRLAQQLREKDAEMERMKMQMSHATLTEDELRKYGLTDEQTQYGVDLYQGTDKFIQQRYINPLMEQLRHLEEQTKQLVEDSTRPIHEETQQARLERFQSKLDRLAPEWESLNTDKLFLGWLQKYPAKWKLLKAAEESLDAQSAAETFSAYLEQRDGAKTSVQKQTQPSPKPAQPRSPRKTTMTEQEFREEMQSIHGLHPDKRAKRLAELRAAIEEGRVQPDQRNSAARFG